MEIQEVKNWMNRGYKINHEIESIERSRSNLYSKAVSMTPQYGGETVAGTKDPHKMDRYLEAVERYAEQTRGRIAELSDISGEILHVICAVEDGKERTVLIERYLNFFTWERIAVSMGYSWRQVVRIHGKALLSVKKILERNGKMS